jgi:hypothetical protein
MPNSSLYHARAALRSSAQKLIVASLATSALPSLSSLHRRSKRGCHLLWKEGTAGALIMAPTIILDGDADVAAPAGGTSFAEMFSA